MAPLVTIHPSGPRRGGLVSSSLRERMGLVHQSTKFVERGCQVTGRVRSYVQMPLVYLVEKGLHVGRGCCNHVDEMLS